MPALGVPTSQGEQGEELGYRGNRLTGTLPEPGPAARAISWKDCRGFLKFLGSFPVSNLGFACCLVRSQRFSKCSVLCILLPVCFDVSESWNCLKNGEISSDQNKW